MTAIQFSRIAFGYTVTFRYDAEVVQLVKSTVPSFARSWQPERRAWFVDLDYADGLAAAMRGFGHTVVGIEPEPPPHANHYSGGDADQWARTLFRTVGPTRREPVFRALTRVLHPDNTATGDTRLQRELNSARDELMKGKSN